MTRTYYEEFDEPCEHCGAAVGEPCWDDPHPKSFKKFDLVKALLKVLKAWRDAGKD